jgi:hypothetical protein
VGRVAPTFLPLPLRMASLHRSTSSDNNIGAREIRPRGGSTGWMENAAGLGSLMLSQPDGPPNVVFTSRVLSTITEGSGASSSIPSSPAMSGKSVISTTANAAAGISTPSAPIAIPTRSSSSSSSTPYAESSPLATGSGSPGNNSSNSEKGLAALQQIMMGPHSGRDTSESFGAGSGAAVAPPTSSLRRNTTMGMAGIGSSVGAGIGHIPLQRGVSSSSGSTSNDSTSEIVLTPLSEIPNAR